MAERQKKVAVDARTEAEALINFMLFELRDKLQPIGKLELLDSVARRAQGYFKKYPPEADDWDALSNLMAAHSNLGQVLQAQGNLTGALAEFQAGMTIMENLVAHDPGNASWQRDLARSHNQVGGIFGTQGDLAGAASEYRASLTIMERNCSPPPLTHITLKMMTFFIIQPEILFQ